MFPSAVHHLALTVTDLDHSRAWYRRLVDADPVIDEEAPALPGHRDQFHHTIFQLSGGMILALHAHGETDRSHSFDELRPGMDHIGFTCRDRAELERLQAHLADLGIPHAGVATDALGHALSFRDPDNIALEFWAPRQ